MTKPRASDDVEHRDGHCGATYYRIDGPLDGRPLLLVHGATVPNWEFDYLVPELVAAGYRCLRYDLLGHGASSYAAQSLPIEAFVDQLREVLAGLDWPKQCDALGHSLGAAVLARSVSADPERYARVVLMAPMLDFSARNPFARILRRRVVGELFMHGVGLPLLVRRRRRRYTAIGRETLVARFREQARQPGFVHTLLRLERDGTLGDQTAAYDAFGRNQAHCPTRPCILWGSADKVIPRADIERVRALVGAHDYVELEGLEHNLMISHPERVAAALERLLRAEEATI